MKEDIFKEMRNRLVESDASQSDNAEARLQMGKEAAKAILKMTGEDARREGILKTPERFAKAYEFLFEGYRKDPQEAIGEGVFPSEGSGLVNVRDVEFFSMCEHHLLPFWGKAQVLYFPKTKILGLSKIPRLIDLFCRRVQVQERVTEQLISAIKELIDPRAVAVQLEAQHLCMMMRGVEKQVSSTKTEKIDGFEQLETWEQQQLLNMLSN